MSDDPKPAGERKLTDADVKAVANEIIEQLMNKAGRGLLGWLLKASIAVLLGMAGYQSVKGN